MKKLFFILLLLSIKCYALESKEYREFFNSDYDFISEYSRYYSYINKIAIPIPIDKHKNNIYSLFSHEVFPLDAKKMDLSISLILDSMFINSPQFVAPLVIENKSFCFIQEQNGDNIGFAYGNDVIKLDKEFLIYHELEHCYFIKNKTDFFSLSGIKKEDFIAIMNKESIDSNVNKLYVSLNTMYAEAIADVASAIYMANKRQDPGFFDVVSSYRIMALRYNNDFEHLTSAALNDAKEMFINGDLMSKYNGDHRLMALAVFRNHKNILLKPIDFACFYNVINKNNKAGFTSESEDFICSKNIRKTIKIWFDEINKKNKNISEKIVLLK